jgi:hypothetical protein
MPTAIRKSTRPRPDGMKSFIARHMGISLQTYYKYRAGIWPQPFDYDQRHAAAEAAWEQHQPKAESAA